MSRGAGPHSFQRAGQTEPSDEDVLPPLSELTLYDFLDIYVDPRSPQKASKQIKTRKIVPAMHMSPPSSIGSDGPDAHASTPGVLASAWRHY